MMMFLVLKERLRSFYGKYAAAADGMVKFIYSFAALWMMSHNLGFMTRLNSMAVVLLLSLFCAFLPYGAIAHVFWQWCSWPIFTQYLWRLL